MRVQERAFAPRPSCLLLTGAALCLAGCDRIDQTVYNCERAQVIVEGIQEPLRARSWFTTMGQNHDYDRRTYIYADGTRHPARVLPADADNFLAKKALSDAARVDAMCERHGPGALVVTAR